MICRVCIVGMHSRFGDRSYHRDSEIAPTSYPAAYSILAQTQKNRRENQH